MAAPHPLTPPDVVRDAYLTRQLAVEETARQLQANAGYILQDLERGRTPSLRSVLDNALKLARDIEVMTAVAALPAAEDDEISDEEPEPDWRFEWELVARTKGDDGGDAVLKHKSIEGRYRIIHEEDL
jgi:hypothetical protein